MALTRTELIADLAAIKRRLARRIIVTRIILDADGNEIDRITRTVRPLCRTEEKETRND
jgi:hypothetical protein